MPDPRDEIDQTEEQKMEQDDLLVDYMENNADDLAEIELDNI